MKLAEALILRKQLVQKIGQLNPLKSQADDGYFKEVVKRIRVTDPIPESKDKDLQGGQDEVTKKTPLITPDSIFESFDEHATALRKLDAAIQQANWAVEIDAVKLPKGME